MGNFKGGSSRGVLQAYTLKVKQFRNLISVLQEHDSNNMEYPARQNPKGPYEPGRYGAVCRQCGTVHLGTYGCWERVEEELACIESGRLWVLSPRFSNEFQHPNVNHPGRIGG